MSEEPCQRYSTSNVTLHFQNFSGFRSSVGYWKEGILWPEGQSYEYMTRSQLNVPCSSLWPMLNAYDFVSIFPRETMRFQTCVTNKNFHVRNSLKFVLDTLRKVLRGLDEYLLGRVSKYYTYGGCYHIGWKFHKLGTTVKGHYKTIKQQRTVRAKFCACA
jgi:hypothetical protein